VESVVRTLEDPIDPDFARSFVIDTSSDEIGAEVIEKLVGELLKVPARVWHQTFAALLDYDDLGELQRITASTMLIWGDADRIVGRDMQEQLEELLPSGELLVYAGIGHTPRWEDAPRFAADVAAFVERLARA